MEVKKKEKTETGIILPETANKLEEAEVIEVAEGVNVKPGQTVLFKDYSMDVIELDGKELSFIKEEHILGVKE